MRAPSHHREHTADKPQLQFKEDPDAWLMVDDILSKATYPQTKCMPPESFYSAVINSTEGTLLTSRRPRAAGA